MVTLLWGDEDFDQRFIEHLMKVFRKKTRKDMRADPRAVHRLRREIRKRESQASFEHLQFYKDRSSRFLYKPDSRQLVKSDIDEFILMGGSTRIPKIQQLVKEFFNGKEPSRGINPVETVPFGSAAFKACILSGGNCDDKNMVLLDAKPHSMGIATERGNMSALTPGYTVRWCQQPSRRSSPLTLTFGVLFRRKIHKKVKVPLSKITSCELTDLHCVPQCEAEIQVDVMIDANGIHQVSVNS
ncbi:hypothetical protein TCAL_09851 [Tigriopus californicus]|uniref:Uncharacterized protein n=1 Tax=Tigriopus californicus TaxID=6832 RepID=A0A553PDH0_TIGCA|nr:hypothetical protein TCAL_09851 [Tigriopus californicus]